MSGIATLAAAFAAAPGRAALMPYLMGGFPDLDGSRAIGEAYAEGGADLVELGVPYSDPLADGAVIHAAGGAALAAGADVHGVLEVGRALSASVPVVLMCYANIIFARGIERFVAELAEREISGLIVPDLPLEESDALRAAADAAQVALVALVAPTTPDDRLAAIGSAARGFIYAVSVTGTTGERRGAPATDLIGRAQAHAAVPVALGFGVADPAAAGAAADAGADGVIVGTRLVRAAAEAADPARAVGALVREFAAALR